MDKFACIQDFYKKHHIFLTVLMMLYTLTVLTYTDSYFAIYLLMGIAAFVNFAIYFYGEKQNELSGKEKRYMAFMASCIGICITLANYKLFSRHHLNIVKGAVLFWGSREIVKNDLYLLYQKIKDRTWNLAYEKNWTPVKVFIVSFCLIAAVDLIYLMGSAYPGILTPDSVDQVHQILTGSYSNHHPFWQTQSIRFWLRTGLFLWNGNLNSAIALYSTAQICFMAFCFAYMLMTFKEAGLSWKIIAVFLAFTALAPYHISYSVTMWKNIPFSGAMLLFTTALFRMLHSIGREKINLVLFAFSSLCVCLWQSNGIPAFILTMGAVLLVIRQKRKIFGFIALSVLCLAVVLVGPALKRLNVKQTEVNEALSIPQQQMARVLHDKKHVSSRDLETLSHYADVNLMAQRYKPDISDNTKGLIHGEYFLKHKKEYFKVWIKLGLRYPWEYGKAWIEETRGYWNGGYKYWIWAKGIHEKAKIEKKVPAEAHVNVKAVDKLYSKYFSLYTKNIMVVFLSIGLHVWLLLLLCTFCVFRKKKDFVLAVPALSVICTLLVSTPVFSEFRYAYSVFTTLPMVLMASFYTEKQKNISRDIENHV